ncbi:MAG TPA: Ig-like domain-containing protein, partial [Vicinamibacterales bacterium]|nr:Ig-like domain-containing protein [Vicinamibacterales bacterium]
GAGTPVQNGTLVSFTTTIGRIEPSEARTQNGQVRVRFIAGNQSGTATITAFSGGASGRLENLRVGTAAVERVILSANPQALGPSGGSTEIQARVEDVNGLGLSGVPVSFTASAGALSPNPATTDANGVATTTLSTTQEAEVTASVGGKTSETALKITLRPRTGIRITAPTDTVTAGQPARFTIGVSENANVSNVTVSYGDGDSDSLGALSGETTIAHVYDEAGTYRVQASARDVTGFTESVATSLTVLPGQPPGVTITASNPTPAINEVITLIANVTGATSTIVRYSWNFGADAVPATLDTTSNRVTVRWTTAGTKGITVTVFQATGPSGDGGTTVVVRP